MNPDGASVDVNWNGMFTLDLTTADGEPLITVDETACTFDVQGDPVTVTIN